MTYCRFRNSKLALENCVDELEYMTENNGLDEEGEELAPKEDQARENMVALCRRYIEYSNRLDEIKRENS